MTLRLANSQLLGDFALEAIARCDESPLQIRAVLRPSVEERWRVGEDALFPSSIERAYYWSLGTGAAQDTTLLRLWRYGHVEMARVNVQPTSQRSWACSRARPLLEWTRDWQVAVHDSERNLVEGAGFRVLAEQSG